jgi:mono/diheme cytochrome c family protein
MGRCRILAGVVLAGIAALTAPARAVEPDASEMLFVRTIQPLLATRCLACHGAKPDQIRGGLDLRTYQAARAGGDSGQPAVVPGKPEASPVFLAITRRSADWKPMPPKENDRLTQEQIRVVRAWIQQGAAWPDAARTAELVKTYQSRWDAADGIRVATSGGLTPEWTNRRYKPENLWAYQPVRKPLVPLVCDPTGPRHPIDAFLQARLDALGLEPAPPADRRTLIRRVTFDLIGLPPTPAEVEAFRHDPLPDGPAFAKVVERLLASPHYGEHWGRHWLDVVRYADSSGFANDYERGAAWRYRDYVIRAFNQDKPYDQFIREQLAGDEIAPDDPEKLIAVGFLRMGPWELTGMEVARIARQRFMDDVTDAVGQVFLGHMLQCARCHDHKFDPVPTRDYYSVQAVFATTQIADRPAPFLPAENTSGFAERRYLEQRRADHIAVLQRLDQKSLAAAEDWFAKRGLDPRPFQQAVEQVRSGKQPGRVRTVFDAARNVLLRRGVPEDQVPPRHLGFTPQDFGLERIAAKGLERLAWEFDRYEPVAFSVYDGPTPDVKAVLAPPRLPQDPTAGTLEQVAILAGGDAFTPTQPVAPSVLSVVAGEAPPLPRTMTGRRLALADWIASPRNPLTARVLVNRVWQWHFGQALAGNPNNFGATGKKPTHPELLDWLAATFIEQGWSIKKLHRLILSSEAYRRSADYSDPARLARRDPDRISYAVFRPRRLAAEELRDALLQVSGELNPAVGGIPVRPEINLEAALQPRQVMGTFASAWEPSPLPQQRCRRSVYALKLRGLRDPFLEVFNEPNPDLSCEAREASTITPQVFSLFNGRPSHDRALAFAARLRQEASSRADTIARAFLLAYGRPPTESERQACLAHWEAMTARQRQLTPRKPTYPREVVREAVEENTGEKFTFVEPLHACADFVADLQPADVDAETRGLADVCLVLFNANEFLYVY